MKRILAILLMLCLCCGFAAAEEVTLSQTAEAVQPAEVTADVADIQRYGHVMLDFSGSSLLEMGYAYGDVLSISLNGLALEAPLISNYSDIDNQEPFCLASDSNKKVLIGINMGDLAARSGIAEKEFSGEDDSAFEWKYLVEQPVRVTISLKEKGGYLEGFRLHQMSSSTSRADYPDLSDEEYANFRNVNTTGMGAGALYRSTTPIASDLNRSREADEALDKAGIRTILNLAETEAVMKGHDGYAGSHYSERDVIAVNMVVDITSDDFRASVAKGLAYMAAHEGPYLVHCKEGKDRTGFVCAILECLMGASAEEVTADYMVTYYNFFGVKPGTEQYDAIRSGNIDKILALVFNVPDIYQADLAECAGQYLLSAGLDQETIAALKEKLGKSYIE